MTKPKKNRLSFSTVNTRSKSTNEVEENNYQNANGSDEIDEIGNMDEIIGYIDNKFKHTEETIIRFIEMNTRIINSRIDEIIKDVTSLKDSAGFNEEMLASTVKKIYTKIIC